MLPCERCAGTGFYEPKQRKKMEYKEAGEQSSIATYLKKNYPDLPFETVKHEGKKEHWERNQHTKQNSYDSFPDTRIYFPNATLMIENKKLGTKLTLVDGVTCATEHIQEQYNTHKRLFSEHTKVYFAVGISEAITLIEQVRTGFYPPMQLFKDRAKKLMDLP
jgi:hypothetical protein